MFQISLIQVAAQRCGHARGSSSWHRCSGCWSAPALPGRSVRGSAAPWTSSAVTVTWASACEWCRAMIRRPGYSASPLSTFSRIPRRYHPSNVKQAKAAPPSSTVTSTWNFAIISGHYTRDVCKKDDRVNRMHVWLIWGPKRRNQKLILNFLCHLLSWCN